MTYIVNDDIQIAIEYPGLEYLGQSPEPFVYYEDREVNGVMYRARNAQYQKATGKWHQYSSLYPSFAVVQNAEGAIGFFTMPQGAPDWSTWDGWGQYNVFNVRDFGAKGDGSAPDDQFINAAATAASQAGGGVVYCPPGTYLLSSAVLLDNNTLLTGAFAGASSPGSGVSTGLTFFTAATGMRTNGSYSSIMVANTQFGGTHLPGSIVQWNIAVRDITFDNNAIGNPNGNNAAVFFEGVSGVTVERCQIYNCNQDAISVTSTPNAGTNPPQGNVRILNNTIDVLPTRSGGSIQSGELSIRVERLSGVLIDGNIIGFNPPLSWTPTWSNDGIDVPSCDNVSVTNNMIQWCTDGVGTNNSINVTVAGNVVTNCVGEGISSFATQGSGSSQYLVERNVIYAVQPFYSTYQGYQTSPAGIRCTTPASNDIISNNTLIGPFGSAAIDLEAAQGSCSGNVIDLQGTATGGPYTSNGIKIAATDLTVTNNTIRNGQGTTSAAINLVSATALNNLVITSNNVYNCQTSFLTSAGLPSNSRISGNLGINPYGPLGSLTVPVPASGSVLHNPYPFDCTVYVSGGTSVTVQVGGISTFLSSGSFSVPVNETITLLYSATPTWVWVAN
jgi:hypothetical protein